MGFFSKTLYAILIGIVAWLVLKLLSEDPFKQEEMVYGKNMIITGASSGIGRETAILACEMGANVFITARRENLLKEVIERCDKVGRKGAKHGYQAADMGNLEQSKSVVLKAAELHGGIDFLILNHGYEGQPEMFKYREEDLDNMKNLFDINFFSMVKMTIAAMPYLKRSHGKVATVSSVGGEMGGLYQAPYAATKFSMGGFFNTLEHENFVKGTQVSFTVFLPGAIETPMLDKFMDAIANEGFDIRNSAMKDISAGADPRECGYALIRATSLRDTKVFFPDNMTNKMMVYFAKIFPDTNKKMLKYFFSSS